MQKTPLEIVALVLLHLHEHGAPRSRSMVLETASKILGAYDGFLGILADQEKRKHLETLDPCSIDGDSLFNEGRKLSHDFNSGIIELFFRLNSDKLAWLTEQYGVF